MTLHVAQVGIALVGVSSLLSGEGSAQVVVSTEEMLLGMGLIVASQVPLHGPLLLSHTCGLPAASNCRVFLHMCSSQGRGQKRAHREQGRDS